MATEEEQAKMQALNDVRRAFIHRLERVTSEEDMIDICNAIKADPVAALKSFFDFELSDIGDQNKSLTERKAKLTGAKSSIDAWVWG